MPCKCGNPRPEDKLEDIREEYYDEDSIEFMDAEREKKIEQYEVMIDAIRHGDIPMPDWYKKTKGVKNNVDYMLPT